MSELDNDLRGLVIQEYGFESVAANAMQTPASFTKAQADLYVCGFPCQPYSNLNIYKQTEDERKNPLWESIRYIEHAKPRLFILENVRTFSNTDGAGICKSVRQTGSRW